MVDRVQIRRLIKETLEDVGLHSPQAASLIYHTGLVESKFMYLYQKGGSNVARGFFQCEPPTAVDICTNYLAYRDELMKRVATVCYLDWKYFTAPNEHDWRNILTYNVRAQIVMCRLHYWRVPKSLPQNIKDQAVYWKAYYNSHKGAGTVDHFMKIVETHG